MRLQLPDGSAASTGRRWRPLRKAGQPAFSGVSFALCSAVFTFAVTDAAPFRFINKGEG
ncbi:hypothetical protein M977_04670 [Buttiauxella gaviniae ATCC 51604]|uniref:Uncharacterized protein n=2 Tax=Buttiauxella TaxID=82976 RepID=A0A1B7HG82_9ENTR|nr:hypothetical protein M979_4334 [Buttiauxella noackiae ATCC 51607]OAT16000.1 hypothetical protein M977_04670 [Buttiauxella gaviniae ATCC 51604]